MELDGREARSVDTRARLLDAAAAVLHRDGFNGATTERIAREAGINKALIGYHFGGKDGLYRATVERPLQELAQRLEAMDPSIRSEAKLATFVREFAQAFGNHPLLATLILSEPVAHGKQLGKVVRRDMSSIYAVLRGILDQGVAEGAFRHGQALVVHMTIVGALSFYFGSRTVLRTAAREGLIGKNETPGADGFSQELYELLLEGLRPNGIHPARKKRSKR